jgi:hypothetical protein
VRRRGERGEDEGIRFVALELQSPSAFPWHPARRSSLLHTRGAAAGDEWRRRNPRTAAAGRRRRYFGRGTGMPLEIGFHKVVGPTVA